MAQFGQARVESGAQAQERQWGEFKMKSFQRLTLVRYFPLSLMKSKLHPLFFLELRYSRGPMEILCGEIVGILQHKVEGSREVQERTSQ